MPLLLKIPLVMPQFYGISFVNEEKGENNNAELKMHTHEGKSRTRAQAQCRFSANGKWEKKNMTADDARLRSDPTAHTPSCCLSHSQCFMCRTCPYRVEWFSHVPPSPSASAKRCVFDLFENIVFFSQSRKTLLHFNLNKWYKINAKSTTFHAGAVPPATTNEYQIIYGFKLKPNVCPTSVDHTLNERMSERKKI